MRQAATWALLVGTIVGFGGSLRAWDYSSLDTDVKDRLNTGEIVVLASRPNETDTVDSRFVSVAKLIKATRSEIWEVINDKEDAEDFLDGVLESEVISEGENEMVITQRTRVGGPKGSYQYTLRYKLTPMTRSEFSFVEGEIRNVLGSWWILDGPDVGTHCVVYNLFIDPGIFAPQIVVKRGMKKTMPSTVMGIEAEIVRRRSATPKKE